MHKFFLWLTLVCIIILVPYVSVWLGSLALAFWKAKHGETQSLREFIGRYGIDICLLFIIVLWVNFLASNLHSFHSLVEEIYPKTQYEQAKEVEKILHDYIVKYPEPEAQK